MTLNGYHEESSATRHEFRGRPILVGDEVLVEYEGDELWCRVTGETLSGLMIETDRAPIGSANIGAVRNHRCRPASGDELAAERRLRFSGRALRVLAALAAATHRSEQDVVRDALSVYWYHARDAAAALRGDDGCPRLLRQRNRGDWPVVLILPSFESLDPELLPPDLFPDDDAALPRASDR